jgi:glycolate oxidase
MIYVAGLRQIVGDDWVITERGQMERYLVDETALAVRPRPADKVVLVKPASSQEISEILKLANTEKTPVFIRGGGTGLCGGAVPTQDGIVLSLERLDTVEEIDKENLMIVVQAGVTLATILEAADGVGLFFPPHPGDEGAQAGGMVACNAGGTRAVKWGVIRNYVKGLEVVLPTGEILNLGGKLLKNNQGLDLMNLMIHSEGILGVITKVIFRLYPKSAASATLIVSYDNRHDAIDSVPKILQSGVVPLAAEYFERNVIETSARYLGLKWPATKGNSFLMIILTGDNAEEVYGQGEKTSAVCERMNAVDILMAERREEQANILKIRSELYSSMKDRYADIMDVTVPPARVGVLLDKIDEIAKKYGTEIPTYGHVGDGNIHPHILDKIKDMGLVKQIKREIYQEAIKLGGVITGEHGVGVIRIPDLDLYPDDTGWRLMRGIKTLFDPNNILNPGVGIP